MTSPKPPRPRLTDCTGGCGKKTAAKSSVCRTCNPARTRRRCVSCGRSHQAIKHDNCPTCRRADDIVLTGGRWVPGAHGIQRWLQWGAQDHDGQRAWQVRPVRRVGGGT